MLRIFEAFTTEVDDEEIAVEEIKSQLEDKGGFLKNSVGVIACHYEFVMSGIAQAVCKALPFDIVGTISSPVSTGTKVDALLLSIMFFSSDDVEFEVLLTPPLNENPCATIAETYKTSTAKRPEKPALILSFAPFMPLNSGDEYVSTISEVSGGVPCFGTLAVDDTMDFSNCYSLYNGEEHTDKMCLVLFYGDIKPKFYFANISEDKILDKSAIITKSEGHVIKELNGRPVMEYFKDIGLGKASETQYAMASLPFLVDYNDGTPPVSKIFIRLTEEGYALCAGAVPEGSKLYVAPSDKSDVLFTTDETVDQVLNDIEGASGLLIYSCIARYLILGANQFDEIKHVNNKLGGKIPFMMAYSGGEICPTLVSDGKTTNRFHNNALVACLI